MADINFNTVSVASAVNSADYLHITTGGSHKRIAVSTLINKAKSETLTQVEAALLDKLTDGCFIMHHRKSDNFPILSTASDWTTLQNGGEIADGVFIAHGGRYLVVAPTGNSTTIAWSSQNKGVGAGIANRIDTLSDFDGKSKTAAILADATIGSDGSGYAPGFCSAYSRTNANGYGLTAGKWWLPSIGEMMMIYSNLAKVSTCLSLISGSQQMQTSTAHWSSSESTTGQQAWRFHMTGAWIGSGTKSSGQGWVRPVSEFIQ